jgi:hypothetical protein
MKHEAVLFTVENRNADYVSGQQVAGKLQAVEFQSQRYGKRMCQSGLADARHIFDQEVAPGQQAYQRLTDLQVFADDDLADLPGDSVDFREHAFFSIFEGAQPALPGCKQNDSYRRGFFAKL